MGGQPIVRVERTALGQEPQPPLFLLCQNRWQPIVRIGLFGLDFEDLLTLLEEHGARYLRIGGPE